MKWPAFEQNGPLIIFGLFFTDVPKKISELGRTDRVFLNVSKRGGSSESTQTRFELADRSFNLMKKYPFGIGSGNWQTKSNQYNHKGKTELL